MHWIRDNCIEKVKRFEHERSTTSNSSNLLTRQQKHYDEKLNGIYNLAW